VVSSGLVLVQQLEPLVLPCWVVLQVLCLEGEIRDIMVGAVVGRRGVLMGKRGSSSLLEDPAPVEERRDRSHMKETRGTRGSSILVVFLEEEETRINIVEAVAITADSIRGEDSTKDLTKEDLIRGVALTTKEGASATTNSASLTSMETGTGPARGLMSLEEGGATLLGGITLAAETSAGLTDTRATPGPTMPVEVDTKDRTKDKHNTSQL